MSVIWIDVECAYFWFDDLHSHIRVGINRPWDTPYKSVQQWCFMTQKQSVAQNIQHWNWCKAHQASLTSPKSRSVADIATKQMSAAHGCHGHHILSLEHVNHNHEMHEDNTVWSWAENRWKSWPKSHCCKPKRHNSDCTTWSKSYATTPPPKGMRRAGNKIKWGNMFKVPRAKRPQ